jgi:hypothetical protein
VQIGDDSVKLYDILDDVEGWMDEHDVVVREAELRLVSPDYGYAGLTDAVIVRGDARGILDFKTRRFDDTKIKPYSANIRHRLPPTTWLSTEKFWTLTLAVISTSQQLRQDCFTLCGIPLRN